MTLHNRPPMTAVKTACRAYRLGNVEYLKAYRLQEHLHRARGRGQIGDSLLILEHPPVLTYGKAGYRPDHVLVTPETLEREGISICRANRGGGITYHGPGQLVCYPIFDLRGLELSVRRYLCMLEEVVINSLAYFDVQARRLPGSPGVWVNDAEISSIGINISRGITMHGFTLNVNNDLKHFSYIAACGVAGKKITTISRACGFNVPVSGLVTPVIESFARIFNIEVALGQPASLEGFYG